MSSDPAATGDDEAATPPGLYDPAPGGGEAPWFLPDPEGAGDDPPWPPASARAPSEGDWAAAEAGAAAALARAAAALGALDERVRVGGPGPRRRLMLQEAAALAWHLGERVSADRLALYLAERLPADAARGAGLARAAWALRRLDRGGAPDLDGLAGFLGRAGRGDDPTLEAWRRGVAAAAGLHPLSQAACAWAGWRSAGLADAAGIEGAVLAARLGAAALRPGGLGVVPMGMGGPRALRAPAAPGGLAAWCAGIEAAALAGLLECDRLALWAETAQARISELSGRTPAALVRALGEWPLASAPVLEIATGASRAAVQRNIRRLEAAGLVREVTGQARFRFWQIALPETPAR